MENLQINQLNVQNQNDRLIQRCKSESDLLAPKRPPRIFSKNKQQLQSRIRSKSPYDRYKARSMMTTVEEYPEDLNPFGDDEEIQPVRTKIGISKFNFVSCRACAQHFTRAPIS